MTTICNITSGRVAFSLVKRPDDPPPFADVCSVTAAEFGDLDATCQVTAAGLNVVQTVNREEVPATMCDPAVLAISGIIDDYTLSLSMIADECDASGVSAFLLANSRREAWVFVGADNDHPPKAIAKVRLAPASLFGAAGPVRVVNVTMPVEGDPSVCFGDRNFATSVNNPVDPFDVSDRHPDAAAQPTLAALKADPTVGDGVYGGPVFERRQYIRLGDGSLAHYAMPSWIAGVSP